MTIMHPLFCVCVFPVHHNFFQSTLLFLKLLHILVLAVIIYNMLPPPNQAKTDHLRVGGMVM